MKNNLQIKNGITISSSELEITASRSGGAGGQHVQKASTRVTVRWNVKNTSALDDVQKERVMQNLKTRLTEDGDLIIHNSESRSQHQNKENALAILVKLVAKGLHVPKKRMKTRMPEWAKEERLRKKAKHGAIKKMRSKKYEE